MNNEYFQKNKETWEYWEKSMHLQKAQISKQQKIKKIKPALEISEEKGCAKYQGSGKGLIYDTSLLGCTCPSNQTEYRPCKHMYKLAVDLGVHDIDSIYKEYSEKGSLPDEASPEKEIKISFETHPWSFKKEAEEVGEQVYYNIDEIMDVVNALPTEAQKKLQLLCRKYRKDYKKEAWIVVPIDMGALLVDSKICRYFYGEPDKTHYKTTFLVLTKYVEEYAGAIKKRLDKKFTISNMKDVAKNYEREATNLSKFIENISFVFDEEEFREEHQEEIANFESINLDISNLINKINSMIKNYKL